MDAKSLKRLRPTTHQTANSDSEETTGNTDDIVPGTPSESATELDAAMPRDEQKPKRPRLRRWASLQLEKLKKEEALALQWAREKAEAEEEQIRQDSEIVEVTVGYLRELVNNRWDTEKSLTEANRQAQLLEINTFRRRSQTLKDSSCGDSTICTEVH
ncbi:hypothetical protein EDD22DRAFT_853101 [Suillus occidentalis]|nr:hypothetical protein EDD22DRAFT_853101 [Suillus occidentalis]